MSHDQKLFVWLFDRCNHELCLRWKFSEKLWYEFNRYVQIKCSLAPHCIQLTVNEFIGSILTYPNSVIAIFCQRCYVGNFSQFVTLGCGTLFQRTTRNFHQFTLTGSGCSRSELKRSKSLRAGEISVGISTCRQHQSRYEPVLQWKCQFLAGISRWNFSPLTNYRAVKLWIRFADNIVGAQKKIRSWIKWHM